MANLVCTGAALQCTMGSTPAAFAASGQAVSGRTAAGVVTDVGPKSVPAFGMCTSLQNPQVATASSAGPLVPQPCQPVIAKPWSPGSAKVTIDGVAALDDGSKCKCAWNGVIKVSAAGQANTAVE
jgi:hypothetical protein